MERLKNEAAACGPGCGCHTGGAAGRARWVVGAVIVVIAAVLVVRAVVKTNDTATEASETSFAAPNVAADAPAAETNMAATESTADGVTATVVQAPKPEVSSASATDSPAVAASTASATGNAPAAEANPPDAKVVVCGESIGSLSDLNQKAMDKDGVFVFLAGGDAAKARTAATVVEKAAATIRGRGMSMGLFTIADGSREYANLATQVPPPGVIAMVKGRGASAVSGDITESKLMQAFVAASSGGGCGPASGGCGPTGCK
jgi:cytoskeletal protein RodZ